MQVLFPLKEPFLEIVFVVMVQAKVSMCKRRVKCQATCFASGVSPPKATDHFHRQPPFLPSKFANKSRCASQMLAIVCPTEVYILTPYSLFLAF